MPGMTMTEKILAKHSGKAHVAPNDNVWVDVDILMTHDVCGPGTIGIFHDKFGRQAKSGTPPASSSSPIITSSPPTRNATATCRFSATSSASRG